MPLRNDTALARSQAQVTDTQLSGIDPTTQRKALTLCLGSLPEDMSDVEISAVIICAAGGSRAELTALLGHGDPESTTKWKSRRAGIIEQARLGLGALLSGIARLQLTELLVSGLDAVREIVRTPSDNPERRLATLARAGRDLQSVCEYLDRRMLSDAPKDRLGVDPYAPPPSMRQSLQQSTAQLTELVSPDA